MENFCNLEPKIEKTLKEILFLESTSSQPIKRTVKEILCLTFFF
ncbi:hypothetical protein Chls_035 [Chlamydia suis]|uniref:Uncharacterized protein n=1 Tax=Chlamydia suis TaxID=83559 RepID=A0ABX6IRI8_9CHLA|nr:hypothetical protein Chls_035 [Chlamydia suis]